MVDSLSMKEKVVENDILDSDNQGKTGINESVAKTRIHMAKPRQTQSGPLMPGVVLSNSKSERTRNLERFIVIH